jgi:hypothetical protein
MYFSNEVPLDGPSWYSCFFDEEAFLRALQASNNGIKGGRKWGFCVSF